MVVPSTRTVTNSCTISFGPTINNMIFSRYFGSFQIRNFKMEIITTNRIFIATYRVEIDIKAKKKL